MRRAKTATKESGDIYRMTSATCRVAMLRIEWFLKIANRFDFSFYLFVEKPKRFP